MHIRERPLGIERASRDWGRIGSRNPAWLVRAGFFSPPIPRHLLRNSAEGRLLLEVGGDRGSGGYCAVSRNCASSRRGHDTAYGDVGRHSHAVQSFASASRKARGLHVGEASVPAAGRYVFDNWQKIVPPAPQGSLVLQTEALKRPSGFLEIGPPFKCLAASPNERRVELRFQIHRAAFLQLEMNACVCEGSQGGADLLPWKVHHHRRYVGVPDRAPSIPPAQVSLKHQTVMARSQDYAVVGHHSESFDTSRSHRLQRSDIDATLAGACNENPLDRHSLRLAAPRVEEFRPEQAVLAAARRLGRICL
jgi:hypothetical protein